MKVLALVFFLSVAGWLGAQPALPPIEETLGSAKVVRTISEATTLHVWRLEARTVVTAQNKSGRLADVKKTPAEAYAERVRLWHSPVGDGKLVDENAVAEIKSLLLEQKSYLWTLNPKTGEFGSKGCNRPFAAKVVFSTTAETIETWFCLGCSELLVLGADKGEGGGNLDPVRRELLAWFKRSLPDDPVIAKIRQP